MLGAGAPGLRLTNVGRFIVRSPDEWALIFEVIMRDNRSSDQAPSVQQEQTSWHKLHLRNSCLNC